MRLLNRAVSAIYDDALRPHGVRLPQMNILTVVALHGPIPPGRVARLRQVHSSTVIRAIEGICGEADALFTDEPGLAMSVATARIARIARIAWPLFV